MRLVEQWRGIERELPDGWDDARMSLEVAAEDLERTSALLGPLAPGLSAGELHFSSVRRGGAAGPDGVRRLLRRLDREGIRGRLELRSTEQAAAVPEPVVLTLADAWDAALAALPSDWSDVYAEVELRSSDHLPRAALLLAPVNPARADARAAYRFRCARRFGYGASPGMTRRCLERCDAEQISGSVTVLRALSDTRPVATQGPVWYVDGRSV